jgi:hypothetical protein
MTTNQISTQIATLQKTLKTTTNKTLKDTLKKKIERLKGDLQNSGKTTKQLTNELLKGKNKVNNMNAFEFKETVRKLAQKPEYTFLKSMGKSEIKDDLKRYAKPVGWRFKGRGNYEKPTKTDIKNKNDVYWENRPNRTDVVFPAKLENGGALGTGGSSDWGANDGGTFSTKMDGFENKFAKGGKTKKEPKIIRGFSDDEGFEYGNGGGVGKHIINGYGTLKNGTKVYIGEGSQKYPNSDGVGVEGIYYNVKYQDGKEKLVNMDEIVFPIKDKMANGGGIGSYTIEVGIFGDESEIKATWKKYGIKGSIKQDISGQDNAILIGSKENLKNFLFPSKKDKETIKNVNNQNCFLD